MLVILYGILIDVSDLQPQKASDLIFIKESGKETFSND